MYIKNSKKNYQNYPSEHLHMHIDTNIDEEKIQGSSFLSLCEKKKDSS